MGLFKFKKRSHKQEQHESSNTVPDIDVDSTDLTLSFSFPKDFDSIVNDSSLLDDIMNELDSSKSSSSATDISQFSSVINGAETPSSDYNTELPSSDSFFSSAKPVVHSRSLYNLNQALSNGRKPSMTMSTSVPDMTSNANTMIYQNDTNDHVLDSSDDDSESEGSLSIIRRSVTFQSLPEKQLIGQQKSCLSSPNKALKSYDMVNAQKEAMDRMKERHRRQTQKPIQMSPSFNAASFAFVQPSMPVRLSTTSYDLQQYQHHVSMKQRPIVQSQSFTKLKNPSPGTLESGNMIRNTYSLNDIHNGIKEKPAQADVHMTQRRRSPSNNLLKPAALQNKRYSYLQESNVPVQENLEANKPIQFRFKRSISAYPSSQEQIFHDVYQKQFELQQQQHQHQLFMQQLQHQRLQQQIELQQQQIQEQQFIQQQQLQQLQQQQQLINQALLDSTRRILNESMEQKKCHHGSKRPLYERKSCHHRCEKDKHQKKMPCSEVETTYKTLMDDEKPGFRSTETAKITETDMRVEIQVPDKLCKELEQMKLSRSNYSLPDITQFSKQEILLKDTTWRTIKPFDKST